MDSMEKSGSVTNLACLLGNIIGCGGPDMLREIQTGFGC